MVQGGRRTCQGWEKWDPFGKFDPRTQQWLKARREGSSTEGEMTFFQPETLEVNHKLVQIQEAVEKGKFIPDRENDPLTIALGNKEHPGHTRGIGVKVS